MMVRAGEEYYNLEKVAEVLNVSTAEVNRLREQSKLRGFRDGSNWKFRKEDVHTYLAESIKARSGTNGQTTGDSDFDLAEEDMASSFDLLMEEAALPDDSDLVSIAPAQPKSDLDLAALDQEDSDLALAEETQVAPMVMPQKQKAPETPKSSVVLEKEGDSAVFNLAPDPGIHEVDFDDSDSILEAEGSSPQLGLAGESGFDVLFESDEDSVLGLEEEKTEAVVADAVEFDAVEFDLEPSPIMSGDDDSESSSQVIAVDVGLAAVAQEDGPFGGDDFDFMGFDSGIAPPADTAASAPFDSAFDSSSLPDDFGADSSISMPKIEPTLTTKTPLTAKQEEEYSTGILISLVLAVVVLLIPAMMLVDSMLNIWSWNQPSPLNSMLMTTIAGWFGL